MAPDFELKDLNGNNVTISEILEDNKPVILSFFATWCDVCLKEIKDLPEIADQYNGRVYLVSTDVSKNKLNRFINKHKITFPVLYDPGAKIMGKKYDLYKGALLIMPKTFVISPAGFIEHITESYDEERKVMLKAKLAEIKGKKWDKPSEVAVFFTGSANGYLESCNCYKHPYGGFIKLVSWLKQQKKRHQNRILVDSGDFLPHSVSETSAGFIFKALALADYHAIAVGDQDIHFSGFIAAAKNNKLPFMSSNLEWCNPFSATSFSGGKASFDSFVKSAFPA